MLRETKTLCWAAATGILAAFAAIVLASCASCHAGTPTEQVRTALDAFAIAADPAWLAVNEACAYKQRNLAAEAEAGRITTADARAQLGPIRARCHALTDTFTALRQAHNQAAALVEQGRIEEAQVWLQKLKERWRDVGDLEAEGAEPPDAGPPTVTQLDGGAP